MSLEEAFARLLPLVEAELQDTVRPSHHSLAGYYGMMQYHLGWVDSDLRPVEIQGGKRLRPILCLLCCEAAGGDARQAMPAAAAVELVHNFSLVHDDIEDGSHYRRGRRTVWDIWGAAQAINAGDGLFVLARQAVHRLAQRGVPLARYRAVSEALDRACLLLCEGQHFDMAFEGRLDVDLDQYLAMIRLKTATLLATAAQMGVLVAGDDLNLAGGYYRFGENLGLAFQIQDDILGIWGDEEHTGKSAATDIRDKKKTLPVVYALNHPTEPALARQLAGIYRRPAPLGADDIQTTLALLDAAGARHYAGGVAAGYHARALDSLGQGRGEGRAGEAEACLREMAASLLGRTA
jgi:geranylgeranyl diphosphate synthase, type I